MRVVVSSLGRLCGAPVAAAAAALLAAASAAALPVAETRASGEIAQAVVDSAPAVPTRRPEDHPGRLAAPVPEPKAEPRPRWALTEADVARYRKIFALQKRGAWGRADRLIQELGNRLLVGHVQYQRYMHPTAYRTPYHQLRDWLAAYGDHPGAEKLYRLAISRRGSGDPAPPRPRLGTRFQGSLESVMLAAPNYSSRKDLSRYERNRKRELNRQMDQLLEKGWVTATAERLEWEEVQSYYDRVERDQLRGDIAAGYYFRQYLDKTLDYARTVRDGANPRMAPRALWMGGLAAWRQDRLDEAATFFENVARSDAASAWRRTAGGYWAARAHLRQGNPAAVSEWLQVAAQAPRTFYGLLARRALGMEIAFNWDLPELTREHRRLIADTARGERALALIQVGEVARAERELRYLDPRGDAELQEALFALSQVEGLPGLALQLGGAVAAKDGRLYDGALYPIPPWEPEGGYDVDPALVYAFMRQESRFDPWADSSAGAKGLMQLMPGTASFVGERDYRRRINQLQLREPDTNVALGQRYLQHLLGRNMVDGDLFNLAAAYNGGPGNLQKWQRQLEIEGDPLLFIESIPTGETRIFVERVLTNLWIYRLRLGQPTPSLNAIAGGRSPQYVHLDANGESRSQVAANSGR